MKVILQKIRKRSMLLIQNFKSDYHFSMYYAFLRVLDEQGRRIHLKQISNVAHKKKDKWILKYLNKRLYQVIQKYKNNIEMGIYTSNAPIWVCWWTGEDTAPELVKQCIRSIKKQSAEHPVYFIDCNSYERYLDIPAYMLEKVEKGEMGLAHLSDYIRVSLLEKYGGLWLDATIFCSNTIPKEYFEIPVFTCKSKPVICTYISQMRWTTFVLGGWKGNVFYKFLKEAFEEYWSKEKRAIDYLFFDYLIELARCEIPQVLKDMETIPINNNHRDDLQVAMNQAIDGKHFKEIIREDTVLYKLSWREKYKTNTSNGCESVYGYFLNHRIDD